MILIFLASNSFKRPDLKFAVNELELCRAGGEIMSASSKQTSVFIRCRGQRIVVTLARAQRLQSGGAALSICGGKSWPKVACLPAGEGQVRRLSLTFASRARTRRRYDVLRMRWDDSFLRPNSIGARVAFIIPPKIKQAIEASGLHRIIPRLLAGRVAASRFSFFAWQT